MSGLFQLGSLFAPSASKSKEGIQLDLSLPSSPSPMPTQSTSLTSSSAFSFGQKQRMPWEEEPEWTWFFLETYLEALLSGPLLVAETLANLQFQRRIEDGGEGDHESEVAAEVAAAAQSYESVQGGKESVPLYLPSFQRSDLVGISKALTTSEQEGWTGNFKGHLTHFMYRSAFLGLQPYLEEVLNDTFNVYEDVNPITLVASHVIVGTVLNPLELVKSRLIAQSNSPHRKKYFGPFHALFLIGQEERVYAHSGYLATFYSPRLLLPTITLHTISPFIRYVCTCFIEDQLELNVRYNPVLYKLAQIFFLGVEALITCPVELVRTRLFVQRLNAAPEKSLLSSSTNASSSTTQASPLLPPLDTCVETSHQTAYSGSFAVIKDVLLHEGGRGSRKKLVGKNAKLSVDDWQSIYGETLGGKTGQKDGIPGLGDSSFTSSSSSSLGIWSGLYNATSGFSSLFRSFQARYLTLLIQFLNEEINREF